MQNRALLCAIVLFISTCNTTVTHYDLLIENGTVYDGSGGQAYVADIGVNGDRVVAIGQLQASANELINAEGFAVAPGFINMLSWATDSLIIDGRSQGDIRQGVTLEVFGEGRSEGPLNEAMREQAIATQGDIKWPVEWTTLDEYLEFLIERGVSPNVASFIGAIPLSLGVLPSTLSCNQKLVVGRQVNPTCASAVFFNKSNTCFA